LETFKKVNSAQIGSTDKAGLSTKRWTIPSDRYVYSGLWGHTRQEADFTVIDSLGIIILDRECEDLKEAVSSISETPPVVVDKETTEENEALIDNEFDAEKMDDTKTADTTGTETETGTETQSEEVQKDTSDSTKQEETEAVEEEKTQVTDDSSSDAIETTQD
jgi:hypothetical protein